MAVELKIGDYVQGKKFASLEHDFKGEIEKVYENSVLILIKEFTKSDEPVVNEYNHRAVVRKGDAKLIKAAPQPVKVPEPEA
ncbi:hypothetical protein [Lactiplantibacillus xiangfangensis]|uniref:DUF2187 domain-containing protein n=1 Tax=Lactiplantibacillus xiangfangensis TaxID=942150 RepID=A0A0R2MDG1_9LACO|nr:hypothetical protein [Lactiplantibacillus xiangfangensis]KRO11737.1 hypothetical protein IV64_GL002126 [Lactiplantibacillus xiangfangensis]